MNNPIRVGITQGDFNGIGPEIILGALCAPAITDLFTPVVFADWNILESARRLIEAELPPMHRIQKASDALPGKLNIVDLRLSNPKITPGSPSPESGAAAVAALERAVEAVRDNHIDVIVTAPISKEAVQSENFRFSGHTEYLNDRAGEEYRAQMILFDDLIKVALVTTHLPLADIPAAITSERVYEAVTGFARTLREDFGIERPKIAVLSLNPHCGDGGLLGNEEKDVIAPVIDKCIQDGTLAFGPFAADGFFGTGAYRSFDGVLAMYHDQGLAPFKALAREHGVNFTAGLPFVRTSPDHGTAFDIAWTGKADPTSMREAIYKSIDIFRARNRYKEASANPLRVRPASQMKPERERRNNPDSPAAKPVKQTAPPRQHKDAPGHSENDRPHRAEEKNEKSNNEVS